jgi:hypothetical protein
MVTSDMGLSRPDEASAQARYGPKADIDSVRADATRTDQHRRCETHISAALMPCQPAALDGERHARALFDRLRLSLNKSRPLISSTWRRRPTPARRCWRSNDAARGPLGISVGSSFGVFHQRSFDELRARRNAFSSPAFCLCQRASSACARASMTSTLRVCSRSALSSAA